MKEKFKAHASHPGVVPWRFIVAFCAFAVPACTGILAITQIIICVIKGFPMDDGLWRIVMYGLLLHMAVLALAAGCLAVLVNSHKKFLSLCPRAQTRLAFLFWLLTLTGWAFCLTFG